MLRMEGDREIARPRTDVFAKLTDLHFLVKCVPDVSEVKHIEDRSATLVVRPSFAFVRGSLDLTIEKLEEVPPSSATMRFWNKGIGSHAEVEASFTLTDQGGGTLIHWVGELKELGGLLKLVPKGLIQGSAQRVVNELLERVEQELGKQ